MKSKTFSELHTKIKGQRANIEEARKKLSYAERNFTGELLERDQKAANSAILAAQIQMKADVQTAIEQFSHLAKEKRAAALSGANIPDDIRLFSTGIDLSSAEVEALAERHAGNYVMQRVIQKYAREHDMAMVDTGKSLEDEIRDVETGLLTIQSWLQLDNDFLQAGCIDLIESTHSSVDETASKLENTGG